MFLKCFSSGLDKLSFLAVSVCCAKEIIVEKIAANAKNNGFIIKAAKLKHDAFVLSLICKLGKLFNDFTNR